MRRIVMAVASVAFVTAACASDGPPMDEAIEQARDAIGVAAVTADADTATPRPAADALWWTAETTDGEVLESASLAGQDVVLWMWAPWCSVCNREAPDVARALADLPADVTVIGVAGRDDLEPMQAFISEHGLDAIDHVVDEDGSLWASYGISYQPAWVFIAADGEAAVAAGAIGYDGLFAGIDQVFGGA